MKVGDYVRLKNGIIDKITNIDIGKNYYHIQIYNELDCYAHTKDEIIKSSPNIIDLIEIGDIVNYGLIGGGMVLHKENDKITTNTLLFGILENKDIKKVITKEQLESIEYKVGD